MERRDKLLSGLNLAGSTGVEIGPLYRPIVAKADGNIFYVDHANTEALRKKYAADPSVNVSDIVDVDAVWGKGTLRECLYIDKADYCIASHVIEHVPDLISWLEEIESILTPLGSLRLVVPDRRFTFDYLRRESRLCDIVNAYVLKARTPLPIAILDHFISVRQVDTQDAWKRLLPVDLPLVPGHDLFGGIGLARDQIANGTYHDVHCWVFTPHSFAQLFAELTAAGLVHFACERLYDTERGELEFIVVLRLCADREETIESWNRAASQVSGSGSPLGAGPPTASTAQLITPDAELEGFRSALAVKEKELAATKETLASILNSRSWKLTEPLRSLRHILKW